jgi:hypothetical protein
MAEIIGLPPMTARAGFDERAFTVESLRFFMQHVVDVPRFSTASANDVHGVFLQVLGRYLIGGRCPPGSVTATHAGGKRGSLADEDWPRMANPREQQQGCGPCRRGTLE